MTSTAMDPIDEITMLVTSYDGSDPRTTDRLVRLLYDQIYVIASQQRGRWHGDFTLNTTALISEAYLKLVDLPPENWKSRAHFMAVMAKALRCVLMDYTKRKKAAKRGGDQMEVTLVESRLIDSDRWEDFSALEEALQRLEKVNPRHSRIVEMRFFGGMSIEETAEAMNLSTATVKRGWNVARAWLHHEIKKNMLQP